MHPWQADHWLPGVLSKQQVKKLIENVYLDGITDFKRAADYSSIDLTLSEDGYRMTCGSIKPCGMPNEPYRVLISGKYAQKLVPDADGCFELKANQCYVFKLKERLTGKLSGSNIFGMATAKSSVGRADVIARLIVDGMRQYEYLNPDEIGKSSGEMYLEIIPISFNVRVKPGKSLSQLRLFYGNPDQSIIRDKNFIKDVLIGSDDGEGYLSVDLSRTTVGGLEVTAYRADVERSKGKYIDLWKKDEEDQKPNPCESWCFASSDADGRLMLDSNSFYILRSKERIALPSRIAVYARTNGRDPRRDEDPLRRFCPSIFRNGKKRPQGGHSTDFRGKSTQRKCQFG